MNRTPFGANAVKMLGRAGKVFREGDVVTE